MPGAFRPGQWNWKTLASGIANSVRVRPGGSYYQFWTNAYAARAGGGPPTPPPGGGGGTPVTTITQNGITFTFNATYTAGQFVNGDWWVIPPAPGGTVTINAMTPTLVLAGASTRNGAQVNPTTTFHPYDGRASNFDATKQLTLPYTASAGQSIIKTASLASAAGTGANATYLDKAVVLTVLDTAPAAGTFRPPYYGTYKPLFTQAQLITGSLPSLAPVGSPPSLANVEARFQQVQLDHSWNTGVAGRPAPLQSFHSFTSATTSHIYGENIAIDNCEAILRTFLNDTLAAKQNSVNYLVQAGIDWYGISKAGTVVANSGGGGHQGGRKIVVAYAGWLLNDADVKAVAGETVGAGFGEKQQFYWSSAAGGGVSHFTGQPAGMALFGLPNSFSKPFPYSGSGAKDIRDSVQLLVDGGLTTRDAANVLGGIPATTASYTGGLYIDITSTHAILASTICGIVPALRTIFNYDTEIFYADRLWTFGLWTQPDGSPTRALGTPVANLHGTGKNGAIIAAGYGSAYGNAMRNAYYTTTTFTG